jgi:hypothetical protein
LPPRVTWDFRGASVPRFFGAPIMSKILYVVALIQKDAVEHLPVTVAAHEIPILVAVHGEDRVFIDENADLPNGLTEVEFEDEEAVADEFARLEQRYGHPSDSRQSYARQVFRDADNFGDQLERYTQGTERAARKAGAKKAAPAQAPNTKTGAQKASNPTPD